MQILFIGDIFGSPGRKIVRDHLGHVVETNKVDLVIANAANSAGMALSSHRPSPMSCLIWDATCSPPATAVLGQMRDRGILNLGQWMIPKSRARKVLRPVNYAERCPGRWFLCRPHCRKRCRNFAVINLQAAFWRTILDDPFRKADALLAKITSKVIIVIFTRKLLQKKLCPGLVSGWPSDRGSGNAHAYTDG